MLLEPWQSIVTPAAFERIALIPGGEPTSALIVHPQPDLEKIRERAVAAGVSEPAAQAFFAQFS